MTKVELTLLEGGSCEQFEYFVLRNRVTRKLRFPALYALIRHPQRGVVLFDAGYSCHVLEIAKRWPERLYTLTLPIALPSEDEPVNKLAALGISPSDVSFIFLSHFHVDHIGALRDFPHAQFIYARSAWESVRSLGRVAGLARAFMPGLIPDDFESRGRGFGTDDFIALDERYSPFSRGFDVFGDGALLAVELPGHAVGHVGLFVETKQERIFLCADACWTTRSYAENILPVRAVGAVFDDWCDYARSLERIHQFHARHPSVRIVPSHCQQAWEAWRRDC